MKKINSELNKKKSKSPQDFRILILTSSSHPLILDIVDELKKKLNSVYYLVIPLNKSLTKEFLLNLVTIIINIKFLFLFLEIIFKNITTFPRLTLLRWYFFLIYLLIYEKKYPFDIIDSHWIYPAGVIATTYAKYKNKKVLITAHGYDADERSFNNPKLKQFVLKTASESIVLTGEHRLFKNLTNGGLKNVILTNQFIQIPELKLNSSHSKEKLGINENAFVILFGPKLSVEYGINEFVGAVIESHKKINNLFIICIGVGDKKKFIVDAFKKNNIQFLISGAISHDKVIELLQISDVVCNPGYFGQGIFTLEAWGCKKPVLALSKVKEIKIEDGHTGLLSEKDNAEEFSKNILKLFENYDLRTELGLNGFEKLKDFSREKRIREILTTYSNL